MPAAALRCGRAPAWREDSKGYEALVFGMIAEIWSELIATVVGAVLGWFSKHYRDNRKNKKKGK